MKSTYWLQVEKMTSQLGMKYFNKESRISKEEC